MGENTIISRLALAGHDSEAFSFLDGQYIEQLENHPAACRPLYTFGSQADGALRSLTMWNACPGCLAFTYRPNVVEETAGWLKIGSFVTRDQLLCVEALVLVRQIFSSSYTCGLNNLVWIEEPADRQCHRLGFIRGYGGRSIASPEWALLKVEYFDWMLSALDKVAKG